MTIYYKIEDSELAEPTNLIDDFLTDWYKFKLDNYIWRDKYQLWRKFLHS